ncbi:uncharacterized protein LOC131852015 isoform X3 [Achroia grisella]|uniref:uncharacterized protein LOC131852015 isoform X3 n=1 Tax=Achroia grisella TaxID=688607 RepID=UPI0027D25FD9|nr:uncharacterized protein LOC131852015 isoform X3 [Achroia grisella]
MSTDSYRKCAKCQATAIKDGSHSFHRFPKPGKTNVERARAWAKFCWPLQDWTSLEALTQLFKSNKVLCKRHFKDICFTDNTKKQLGRFSVPTEDSSPDNFQSENIPVKSLESSAPADKQNVSKKQLPNTSIPDTRLLCENSTPVVLDQDALIEQQIQSPLSHLDDNSPAEHDDVVPTEKEPEVPLFSWEEGAPVVCDDDVITDSAYVDDNRSMYNDDAPKIELKQNKENEQERSVPEIHDGYKCNDCKGAISGFRYTCVQCEDYDLCEACEASRGHSHHYMLRVPGPRPQGEVKSLIDVLRDMLNKMTEIVTDALDGIKEENEDIPCEADPFDGVITPSALGSAVPSQVDDTDIMEVTDVSNEEEDVSTAMEQHGDHETVSPNCNQNLLKRKASEESDIVVKQAKSSSKKMSLAEYMEEEWLNESLLEEYDSNKELSTAHTTIESYTPSEHTDSSINVPSTGCRTKDGISSPKTKMKVLYRRTLKFNNTSDTRYRIRFPNIPNSSTSFSQSILKDCVVKVVDIGKKYLSTSSSRSTEGNS